MVIVHKSHRYFIWLILIIALAWLLRFINLAHNPPALYWDEASIGYNAFSILTKGIDEHGVKFPLTHFLAYGDAKPPVYIYATSLAMAVFGVNEFSVRFSSALAGVAAVLVTFFLTRELFAEDKNKLLYSLIASLLLAVSPWHLQMSRAGFEANLALTFFLVGLWLFLKGLSTPKTLPAAAIFFVATLYTFNAYRIFLPLFIILLATIFYRQIIKHLSWSLVSLFVGAGLVLPLIPFALSSQAKLRFDEVNIFKDHAPIVEANLRQELNQNVWWSKIFYNRRVLFGLEFLKHYTDQLKPEFLFVSGDANPRLSTRDQGELYLVEFPLLLYGLYLLIRHQPRPLKMLLIGWLLLAFIPAGIARETPHALRSLQALPTFQILIALAIVPLIQKKIIRILLFTFYFLLLAVYLETYHHHYPLHWSDSWQYGYKQLVAYIKDHQNNFDKIFITDKLGRPHTYLLFYLQYDPRQYLATRNAGGDPFGFTYTYSFDKYYFTNYDLTQKGNENWLIVSGADAPPSEATPLTTINNLNQQPILTISKF